MLAWQVPGSSKAPGRCGAGKELPRRVAEASCSSTTPTAHLMQVMMIVCQENPLHVRQISDGRRCLRGEGSLGWLPGGPPPRESYEAGKWMRGMDRHLDRHLARACVSAACDPPCDIKGGIGRRCKGFAKLDTRKLATRRARQVRLLAG